MKDPDPDCEMTNSDPDSNSCLGLVSLATASWLIALLQLSYNLTSLQIGITPNRREAVLAETRTRNPKIEEIA